MLTKFKTVSYFVFAILFVFIASSNFIFAQDDYDEDEDDIPKAERYMRDKYIEYYEADFNVVFESVKQYVVEMGAEIERDATADNDIGRLKGLVRSNIFVLTQRRDSVFKVIQRYSFKPPFIRGGVWTSARIQFRILLNDEGDGRTSVVFENELSAFEDNVTFKVHIFKTNGFFEYEGFNRIKEIVESKK